MYWKKNREGFLFKHRCESFKGSRVKQHFIEKGVGGKEEGLGRNVKLDLSLSSFYLDIYSIRNQFQTIFHHCFDRDLLYS